MRQRVQRRSRRRAACALAKDDEPPDPLTATVAAVGAAGSIAGGFSAMKSANAEAQMQQQQGALQQQDAYNAAVQKAYDVSHIQAQQGESYLASGVTLAGTPVQVMAETRMRGQQEITALEQRGQALDALSNMKAKQFQNAGRSAFLQGILGAAKVGASAGSQASVLGSKASLGSSAFSSYSTSSLGPINQSNGAMLPPYSP